jgi:hypothetical protein
MNMDVLPYTATIGYQVGKNIAELQQANGKE